MFTLAIDWWSGSLTEQRVEIWQNNAVNIILFEKNNFIKQHEAHFYSYFENKLRTIPARDVASRKFFGGQGQIYGGAKFFAYSDENDGIKCLPTGTVLAYL